MATKDRPAKSDLSYSALTAETDAPEAFVYTTKASRRVVFPDPGELPFQEAEQWLVDVQKMARSTEVFEKWLEPEDFAAFLEDKLTLREVMALSTRVQRHYGDIFGDQGE